MKTNYIGEKSKNTFGTEMEIVEFKNKSNIIVEFKDQHRYRKKTSYQAFKNGSIKNPYDKTVYGVAWLGNGKYPTGHYEKGNRDSQRYDTWRLMIGRCYEPNCQEAYPAYNGICTVCEEWFDYQNFSEWYERNKYEVKGRLHLDKDILIKDNKIYSPRTCLLVPQRINMLFVHHRPNKYGLPEGIRMTDSGKYSSMYEGKSLGVYETLEEAILIHNNEKEKAIKRVADEYKDIIPLKVYEALMEYRVA